MSSSRGVTRLVSLCLAGRYFSAGLMCSKRSTLTTFGDCRPGLVLLSLVLPKVSKCRIYHRVHSGTTAPVVVLSTGDRMFSGILKLRLKTSSCVVGPFSPGRVITHMETILEECRIKRRGSASIRGAGYTRFSKLAVGLAGCSIIYSKRPISVPPGRLRLLCYLTTSPGRMFAERRLLSHV